MSFSEVLKNMINYFFENIYLMGIWGKVVIISQETFRCKLTIKYHRKQFHDGETRLLPEH